MARGSETSQLHSCDCAQSTGWVENYLAVGTFLLIFHQSVVMILETALWVTRLIKDVPDERFSHTGTFR